jgi:hypothetical protein
MDVPLPLRHGTDMVNVVDAAIPCLATHPGHRRTSRRVVPERPTMGHLGTPRPHTSLRVVALPS